MIEREKRDKVIDHVISAFEQWENDYACGEDWSEIHESRDIVLAMLKAQEPMKPKWQKGYAYCGQCGYKLHWIVDLNNFCPNCGRPVKWE